MKNIPFVIFYAILFLLTGCDRFPKDSEDTLQNARNKMLKVGLSAYDSAAGASVEPVDYQINFVRQFAKQLNAEVVWVKGSQEEIVQLLSHYELHMAIGGYTRSSPFKKEITLTKPYFREKLFLAGFDRAVPGILKEQEVLVNNRLAAFYVRQKGGTPVITSGFKNSGRKLIAATGDELKKLNLQPAGPVLHELKYAIAIPMGESAFLIELEKFIDSYGK